MMKTAIDFLSEETGSKEKYLDKKYDTYIETQLFIVSDIVNAMERYRADGVAQCAVDGLLSFEPPDRRHALFTTAIRELPLDELVKLSNTLKGHLDDRKEGL